MNGKKNIPASVRQQLLNKARAEERPFFEILQYYAMERFLYRLTKSVHADRFVLKGALLLQAWHAPTIRPTMDIDLLGCTSSDPEKIRSQIQEILSTDVEADGLRFDAGSIQIEPITDSTEYTGQRVVIRGTLGTARIRLQLDIGFGDVVYPAAIHVKLPSILQTQQVQILGYSRDSTVAEKLDAMFRLGIVNSRMKDFYDIWILSRLFDFEGSSLLEAVRLTINRRGTKIAGEPVIFTPKFKTEKQPQWTAFLKRISDTTAPRDFAEIIGQLHEFLQPVIDALNDEKPLARKWVAPGRWHSP
jgi:hypothetical protein